MYTLYQNERIWLLSGFWCSVKIKTLHDSLKFVKKKKCDIIKICIELGKDYIGCKLKKCGGINAMQVFLDVAPIILSIFAFFVSIISIDISRKNNISNLISKERMNWIAQVRDLMADFLCAYIKQEEKEKLKIINSKINLYIKFDSEFYQALHNKLTYCVDNSYTEKDYEELVISMQNVLNDVWVRIKREAGILKIEENSIVKGLRNKL